MSANNAREPAIARAARDRGVRGGLLGPDRGEAVLAGDAVAADQFQPVALRHQLATKVATAQRDHRRVGGARVRGHWQRVLCMATAQDQ
jgi:hypothetical protein